MRRESPLLLLWRAAAAHPPGLWLRPTSPEDSRRLWQALYVARQGHPDLMHLSLRTAPPPFTGDIWIINPPPGEEGDLP